MAKRNYGLKTGIGVFIDEDSGLVIRNDETVEIDKNICGSRTFLAIQNGGLVEIDKPKTKNENDDLPADLPGRDAFIAAQMDFEQVKNLDFEKEKVVGIGDKTIAALGEYLKKQTGA